MEEYKSLVRHVLKHGNTKDDRTQTGTISLFGAQNRYDLTKGFPLLTIKKTWWHGIVHELLWFIKGDTNIKYLVENKVGIWNEWPYEKYKKSSAYKKETLKEFIEKIKTNDDFAKEWGELGPVYGRQWRGFEGVDQLKNVINEIKKNPNSRRLIVSAWNPLRIDEMLLPPCHAFFQFYVRDGELSLQLYQRSADIFLGVPFNIASYSLLLMIVAKLTNLKPKEFVHTLGDAHIYSNHIEQCKEMLKRDPLPLSKVEIAQDINSIENICFKDIKLINYQYHPAIKGKVAV